MTTYDPRLIAWVTLATVAAGGCVSSQVHSMSRTTRIADEQFADEYRGAAERCLVASDDWDEYDTCMAPWYAAYASMRILITTTLTLDVARQRREFRKTACRWYRALHVVDAASPAELAAIEAGLSSRWRRRCGKPS